MGTGRVTKMRFWIDKKAKRMIAVAARMQTLKNAAVNVWR